MKQKRVLVTGGAGFLGSFLCEKLLKSGHYVICCDNFYTGSKKNLMEIVNNPNFEIIRHDITCLLYTSPSPRDRTRSRMPSSA